MCVWGGAGVCVCREFDSECNFVLRICQLSGRVRQKAETDTAISMWNRDWAKEKVDLWFKPSQILSWASVEFWRWDGP